MIRLLTDSAADMTANEARERGIELVPLNLSFPDFVYDQATDADFSTFYSLLKQTKGFPKTSQPAPEPFMTAFEAARDAGDTLIAILISGGLSGTLQSAQIAKDTVGYDGIHLIDSRIAIMPQRFLVEWADKLRREGKGVVEIVREIETLKERVVVFGMLDTLTYLQKGGRLSKAAALAGNLLRIKPVITIGDGAIVTAGRGRNFMTLIERFEETGYDPAYPVYFGYSYDAEKGKKLMEATLKKHAIARTGIFPIGGVIGAHVGPGGVAISFVKKA